jgi:hypothetical protein
VIGRERALTQEFLRLESHFLFTDRFCWVGTPILLVDQPADGIPPSCALA